MTLTQKMLQVVMQRLAEQEAVSATYTDETPDEEREFDFCDERLEDIAAYLTERLAR